MIHIADGPSEVLVFSVIKRYGGRTHAAHQPGAADEVRRVRERQAQDRIFACGPVDHRDGSPTFMLIRNGAEHAAKQILAGRQRTAGEKIRTPPRHVVDGDAPGAPPEPEQLPLDGA